jgi:hypothetical protein
VSKLWEKTGTAKNNSDLVEVDQSKLDLSKPTVVFFPGQLTNESAPDFISKDLNEVKELFRDMPEQPQVYLWSHPHKNHPKKKFSLSWIFSAAVHRLSFGRIPEAPINELSAVFRLAAYTVTGQRSTTSLAREQARKLIMPLVTDANGKPLPFEQAQKNLRKLTLVGYCIGNLSVQEVFNGALSLMKKSGFKKKDARNLLKEIVLVSFASFAEPQAEHHRYTTVSLIHNDDSMLRKRERLFHPLRRIFSHFSRRLRVKQLSDTSVLISGTNMGKWWDRKKPAQKEVIEDVRLPAWRKDAFNHFMSDYVNTNDKASQFSRIVQYSLINAVSRTDTVKPVELLKAPAAVDKTAETASYERKITAAARKRLM